MQSALVANAVFALLRADVRFCQSVATLEQAAAEQGVSAAELSRSEAKWLGGGQQDLVGPRFASAWGGSDEEAAEAERIAAYAEAQRLKVWGE